MFARCLHCDAEVDIGHRFPQPARARSSRPAVERAAPSAVKGSGLQSVFQSAKPPMSAPPEPVEIPATGPQRRERPRDKARSKRAMRVTHSGDAATYSLRRHGPLRNGSDRRCNCRRPGSRSSQSSGRCDSVLGATVLRARPGFGEEAEPRTTGASYGRLPAAARHMEHADRTYRD